MYRKSISIIGQRERYASWVMLDSQLCKCGCKGRCTTDALDRAVHWNIICAQRGVRPGAVMIVATSILIWTVPGLLAPTILCIGGSRSSNGVAIGRKSVMLVASNNGIPINPALNASVRRKIFSHPEVHPLSRG